MISITYIGGPTALIEWRGLRLLTDPTFDPAGESYTTPAYTLRKTRGPALTAADVGPVDVVLLSHDHHFDNLDRAGRAMLKDADHVLTTTAAEERLGGNAVGMVPWNTYDVAAPDGTSLRITATPARHGPAHADRGPVIGFVLSFDDLDHAVYVSGDTVWYEGVREVSEQFDVRVALLFLGAAHVAAAGDFNLTFTAAEAVEAARALSNAVIVPVHYEGWEHFIESRAEVDAAFAGAGLANRLRWTEPGVPTGVDV